MWSDLEKNFLTPWPISVFPQCSHMSRTFCTQCCLQGKHSHHAHQETSLGNDILSCQQSPWAGPAGSGGQQSSPEKRSWGSALSQRKHCLSLLLSCLSVTTTPTGAKGQ
ncbi:unnamed protein product, partial [Gulo gulo]